MSWHDGADVPPLSDDDNNPDRECERAHHRTAGNQARCGVILADRRLHRRGRQEVKSEGGSGEAARRPPNSSDCLADLAAGRTRSDHAGGVHQSCWRALAGYSTHAARDLLLFGTSSTTRNPRCWRLEGMDDGMVSEKMFGNHRPAGRGLLGWVHAGVEYGDVWISGMYCFECVFAPQVKTSRRF